MRVIPRLSEWLRRLFRRSWRTVVLEGEQLPGALPSKTLVVLMDDGEPWSAGMMCPCGCGRTLEVMLLPGVKPRWDVSIDAQLRPTLNPSVWVADGCRSHFWLTDGQVRWC